MPFMREMPVFKGLKTATELALMSPGERDTYMWEFDAHRTDLAAYDYAIKEGYTEGKAQGMAQGMAQGKKDQAIETAQRMLAKGFDNETIAQLTGLTPDEISKL